MTNRTRWIAAGLLAAAASGASCARERAAVVMLPSVAPVAPVQTGLTMEQTRLEGRLVDDRLADDAFDARWYEAAGRPRMLVLVNRRFAADSESWRADARVVMETTKGSTLKITNDYEQHDTERERKECRAEGRADTAGDSLPAGSAAGLREGLIAPFLRAGCLLIDPDAVERIGMAVASREQGAIGERRPADVSAEAVRKEADWIIEAAAFPDAERGAQPIVAAKVVDLRNGTILAYATTREIQAASRLAGADNAASRGMPVEGQGRWLARELSRQLAATLAR